MLNRTAPAFRTDPTELQVCEKGHVTASPAALNVNELRLRHTGLVALSSLFLRLATGAFVSRQSVLGSIPCAARSLLNLLLLLLLPPLYVRLFRGSELLLLSS